MNPIDPAVFEGLTEIFRVLGDPTRLRMLDALSRGESSVGNLASHLGLTESAVSHQLRLLRTARLVRARREGRMIFYSLHDTHVLTLFDQALRHVQEPAHAWTAVEPAAPDRDRDVRVYARAARGAVSKPAGGGGR